MNFPGESYPEWEFSRWELSVWELSWVGVVQVGLILGGDFLCRGFSGWEFFGGNHPGGRISSVLFFLEIKRNLCIDNFQILISNLFFDVRKYCF